jgi:hypothetical protein
LDDIVFQLWQTRSLAGVSPESWNEIDNNWQKVEAQVNILLLLLNFVVRFMNWLLPI